MFASEKSHQSRYYKIMPHLKIWHQKHPNCQVCKTVAQMKGRQIVGCTAMVGTQKK